MFYILDESIERKLLTVVGLWNRSLVFGSSLWSLAAGLWFELIHLIVFTNKSMKQIKFLI